MSSIRIVGLTAALRLSMARCLVVLCAALLAACSPSIDQSGGRVGQVSRLEADILALGPHVDPEEAARAARVAFAYTDQLVREYEITDPPLVHNTKVNMGLKPRGLCYHWARDIHTRMAQERFTTLSMTQAVANADNPILLEHTSAVIMARGDGYLDGLVLDPWRTGGQLFHGPVVGDKYDWKPRADYPARKRSGRSVLTSKSEN
ncbi:hypothetical protein OO012_08075 [Rhodobacteraceae bacterium KMM 6894]|nr:hypothetical protein [Rhodobacteraceae bacterium KMM 6894]